MNREKLYQHLDQHYLSRREMVSRIPLGEDPDGIWRDVLNRRKLKGTILPIHSPRGNPYWYVTTDKMAAASDRIISEMMENETEFDPYRNLPTTTTLEEAFFTSYVEGSQLSIQDAMTFIQGDMEPQNAEEQLILNNRNALNFISANLFRPVNEEFINTLANILNESMEVGGPGYRQDDFADIPSMVGLSYEVPRAYMIPDSVRAISFLIADPEIHPLIKSAVAQAWALVTRPYPDGNERLGRILSQFILLRSGYQFYAEVSLSSMIAKKSFAYFNAMANILLVENGGDLTYFIEYFLCLLSDAIAERHLRLENPYSSYDSREEPAQKSGADNNTDIPDQQAEPLPEKAIMGESDDRKGGDYEHVIELLEKMNTISSIKTQKCIQFLLNRIRHGIYTFTSNDIVLATNVDSNVVGNKISVLRCKKIIKRLKREGKNSIYTFISDLDTDPVDAIPFTSQVMNTIQGFLSEGRNEFTIKDISDATAMEIEHVKHAINSLRKRGQITSLDKKNDGAHFYTVTSSDPAYSPKTLETIDSLSNSSLSIKDRRIGQTLLANLSTGEIRKADYEEKRWNIDMRLAEQMGLVEKIDDETYRILSEMKTQPDSLLPYQMKALTAMYENFGEEAFSHEMFLATVDYSSSHVSAILHELTLIRVLDCWKEGVNKYRLKVSPETKPEFFWEVA